VCATSRGSSPATPRPQGCPKSEDRRSPHVLRHTFCTHLADADVPIDVIRQLAGHADIRTTTTIYTHVCDDRLEDAIAGAGKRRRGLGRLAA
jgi:site-specific recombinase XerD